MVHACADPARCPNPGGRCRCGCGAPTRLAKTTGEGRLRGCPTRFVHGHHCRKSPRDFAVDPNTGCWLWLLATNLPGYGVRRRGRGQVYAHRAAYEARFGPIPVGLEIDHRCRQPSCVNPDHLEAVTHAENVRRGRAAKLTPDDVEMIRELHGSVTCDALAWSLGVSPRTIRAVTSGEAWRDAA